MNEKERALCVEAARLGYMVGHDDTVESRFADPAEVAEEIVADLMKQDEDAEEAEDVCGLCGLPGADKFPRQEHWPGEQIPGTELVHASCEAEECARAHAALTDKQREDFLRTLR